MCLYSLLVYRYLQHQQDISLNIFSLEHNCYDPKDGELYLEGIKSGEILMDVPSGSDVQIDHVIWV